ncbi:hypothetical protein BH10BAC5_BH10BAC5_28080 [soil metagenome]
MSRKDDIIDINFDNEYQEDKNSGKHIIDVKLDEDNLLEKKLDIDVNTGKADNAISFINEITEPIRKVLNDESILSSLVDSHYRGNPSLTGKFISEMPYPEGIGVTFRKKFISLLKDEFLNTILENNRFIAASSVLGNIYLTDRFTGSIKFKISPPNAVFEKTGVTLRNTFYINSVRSIYEISTKMDNFSGEYKEIFTASEDSFIWTNLNSKGDEICFITYSPSTGKSAFVSLNIDDRSYYEYEFFAEKDVSDSICMAGDHIYFTYDKKLVKYISAGNVEELDLSFNVNFSFPLIYLNYKLFCINELNEIFYREISKSSIWKFTGIRSEHITSFIGYEDNLFIGMLNGWKAFKCTGTEFFSFEDDSEMKAEAVSASILAVSKGNKIIYYNLKRFTEAEGYITGNGNRETGEIKSVIISFNNIYILTTKGTLECFTADNLNIHI